MIPAICINDSDRPEAIPEDVWPKNGEQYHITHVYFAEINRMQGCDLAEIELPADAYPYKCYRLSRFGIAEEHIAEFMELVQLCTDLNEVELPAFLTGKDMPAVLVENNN